MSSLPGFLHLQRVGRRAVAITAVLALVLVAIGISQRFPVWIVVLLALGPWLPLVLFEAVWKARHYGEIAILSATTALQLGFLITQAALIISAHANGVQQVNPPPEPALVFQSVGPFVGSTIALMAFSGNPWLRAAFALASIRLADELYIFATLIFDNGFYHASGVSGLFAAGGVLGVPMPRVYVIFLFTFWQVLLLLIGILVQARHAYDKFLARAVPGLDESQLVAATGRLQRRAVAPGTVILKQGDPADRFYILSRGEVAVIHEEAAGEHQVTTLKAGQYFGEIGLLSSEARRTATIRALTAAELLTLEREAFTSMIGGADRPKHFLEAEVARRLAELGTS